MGNGKRVLAWGAGLALLAGALVLPGCQPKPYAVKAEGVSLVSPSEGMTSQDEIVYNIDAREQGANDKGEQDCTDLLQSCLDSLRDVGGVVFLPAGRYKVEGTLKIPSGVTLRGEWRNPETDKGLGKGTILMAYKGRGSTDSKEGSFVYLESAATLRDISVWYPEQVAEDIQPYPATIGGKGHTNVLNVTLYNSYVGFYNDNCSSMMIRGLYGTVLTMGIYGADAFDIPRIERVRFAPSYWIDSGLDNAPVNAGVDAVKEYTRKNLVGIKGGQMDWGYWYDLEMDSVKYGVLLVHGNDAIGKIKVTNADVGIYIDNMSYPGLEVSYADIDASQTGIYYDEMGSDDEAAKDAVFERNTLVVSASTFRGKGVGIQTIAESDYGLNLNDCTFESWGDNAVKMNGGHLVCSNSAFNEKKPAFNLGFEVDQAILTGNSFKNSTIMQGDNWKDNDERLQRDDKSRDVLKTPEYEHDFVPENRPAGHTLFNVEDYGAVKGMPQDIPEEDSTAAIQKALDAAAKEGGTVYLPGGVYRVEGALTVPKGVELRGSFDGPHYGNGTWAGTQLYAYGDRDKENGQPLITLSEKSGVRGFTVFYPEQGYSDVGMVDEEKVHAFPPTVRADKKCWIQDMAMIGSYTAIDAMTNRCDDIVIYDVTGAAMKSTLELGHGVNGGVVQNLHFNYSGWTQQGTYESQPDDDRVTADGVTARGAMLNDYTSRVVKGMVLGDCKNVDFFSCFNIIVNTQIELVKDQYTGGSFKGTMWGVAFDAAQNGVVANGDSSAELTLINSMGVFNQQGGGYNVVTKKGFSGEINMFNQDAWGSNSKLAYVEGGTVNLVQYFSWCAYEAECFEGGTLNLLGSTIVANNGNNGGSLPTATYHSGAKGAVIGTLDCSETLNIEVEDGATVDMKLNGTMYEGW